MSGGNESLKALAFRKSPRSQEALKSPQNKQNGPEKISHARELSFRELPHSAVKRRAQEIRDQRAAALLDSRKVSAEPIAIWLD